MFNSPRLTEKEDNEKLERLCGSVDKAFRLSYLYTETKQDCSGWRYRLFATDNTLETFKTRAKSQGYSKEAIELFLKIQ